VSTLESKSFDEPDRVVSQPLFTGQVVLLGEVHVARVVHEPGWTVANCPNHHQGVALSGEVEVVMDRGGKRAIRGGEAFNIPPGHDSRVVGDEPFVAIEFTGVRAWTRPPEAGDRVVATLLVTDIVGSTETASRVGDAAWKRLLGDHGDRVRRELERFRGVEVTTTGDGFLAVFDGAARAARAAAAIRDAAGDDSLRIRAGIHSGEVERDANNVRGVAVHAATRIAGLAGPGEVLVSASTVALLEGADVELEDAGEHELRGLPGRRRLYRLG
jgi:class 3 adenylate cyclase